MTSLRVGNSYRPQNYSKKIQNFLWNSMDKGNMNNERDLSMPLWLHTWNESCIIESGLSFRDLNDDLPRPLYSRKLRFSLLVVASYCFRAASISALFVSFNLNSIDKVNNEVVRLPIATLLHHFLKNCYRRAISPSIRTKALLL